MKGPTESCPQGGWREQNQVLSTESPWKGAKSSFHVIYTLFNNDKCLFFTNVSENITFGRFCENGSEWWTWVKMVKHKIFCLKRGCKGPRLPLVDIVS